MNLSLLNAQATSTKDKVDLNDGSEDLRSNYKRQIDIYQWLFFKMNGLMFQMIVFFFIQMDLKPPENSGML
ncbi:hypothetical protein CM15mP35_03100 [bacterium]|nr:MAG: hypothetical protein CM15mP35_03100 [bacterium]